MMGFKEPLPLNAIFAKANSVRFYVTNVFEIFDLVTAEGNLPGEGFDLIQIIQKEEQDQTCTRPRSLLIDEMALSTNGRVESLRYERTDGERNRDTDRWTRERTDWQRVESGMGHPSQSCIRWWMARKEASRLHNGWQKPLSALINRKDQKGICKGPKKGLQGLTRGLKGTLGPNWGAGC